MVAVDSLSQQMYAFLKQAFPICRSLTGDGVRKTLQMIDDIIPLDIIEVPTGTQVFDWQVPQEWNIKDAFIADDSGNRVIDFNECNLHVVGYSIAVNKKLTLAELHSHLYSLPQQPNAIPYITSYYNKTWGFCLSEQQRNELVDGSYHVYIDASLADGSLTYGEYFIKGESEEEILISTYVCHPSMANNELSGPIVATYIAQWLASKPRKYSYRFIFIPETIGSIAYLSKNLTKLKQNVIAGFNLSCIGDERNYSYVASRYENTLADKVAENVLRYSGNKYTKYSFLDRGSDERQYCSPGVDLPLVTLCRSKYGCYPEYHTSLDNLDLVTPDGLLGGFNFVQNCIEAIENNEFYKINCLCEPQLGKRGLYPSMSTKESGEMVKTMMDFIAYADGKNDLIDISNIIKKPIKELLPIIKSLKKENLLSEL